ncbi:MAG: alkaline phosphatase D family protein [Sphingomonadales bacterium]|nr:alkaline phosphatase D family protein [Sphingomonadales bacterium]
MKLDRREAIFTVGGALLAAASGAATGKAPSAGFLHGVASGDPLQDRVILWTRVTPQAAQDGPIKVAWEMARDAAFRRVVRRGVTATDAAADYTVKVDADGLKPDTPYFYRFKAGGMISPVGRTKTLPVGDVASVVMAVASCALYSGGHFNAYRDMAELERLDLVLHLGDYIYEYGGGPDQLGMSIGSKIGRVPLPLNEAVTLNDYRARHACYRTDADLQAAHARAPWIVVWDDHETANDAWTGGAQNHQPNEGAWGNRKAASVQAFYEWLPIRPPAPGKPREDISRTFELGNLATIIMMENRHVGRDKQIDLRDPHDATWLVLDMSDAASPKPVTDAETRKAMISAAMQGRDLPAPYAVRVDPDSLRRALARPDRSVFGKGLEAWLEGQLKASVQAGKRWQLIGNQMVMARTTGVDIVRHLGPEGWQTAYAKAAPQLRPWLKQLETLPTDLPFEFDGWSAYPAARTRMDATFSAVGGRPVVLSGDSHAFWVNTLRDAGGKRVAAELGTSAITSSSLGNMLGHVELGPLFSQSCPEVKFCQHLTKGYSLVTLTADEVTAELIGMSTVLDKKYERFVLKSYRLKAGDGGAMGDWVEA